MTAAAPLQSQPFVNPQLWECTIVSIAPINTPEVELECQPGFKKFSVKAAPRDGWSTLRILPRIIILRDLTQVDESNPTPGARAVQQDALQVATALVDKWANNTIGNSGRLGVGILPVGASLPSEGEKPSGLFLEFLNDLKRDQTELAQGIVKQASDWFNSGKSAYIQQFHRAIAMWLYGKNASKIKWVDNPGFAELKRCFCSQEIPLDATVCPNCRTDLVLKHIERGTRPTDDSVVLAEIYNVLRSRGETSEAIVQSTAAADMPEGIEPEPIVFVEPSAEGVAAQKALADRMLQDEKKKQ